jgi:hypothetical protein
LTEISNQICEAVSECANVASNANKPFWDLKAVLAAIGISIALFWNSIQYVSSRSRRKRDQQWEMFRDEIYLPFLELLDKFDQEVRPAQLAVRMSEMCTDALNETIGEFFSTVSEVEVFCNRADNHAYNFDSVFSTTFNNCSNELNACIDKALTPGILEENKFSDVSSAYRKLIDELRTCLSNCRKNLH